MKVYRIIENVNHFQWIMPKNADELKHFLQLDCVSVKSTWVPIEMYSVNPKKRLGNFFSLGGIGVMIFDAKALDVMLTQFEMAGEILPIKLDKIELYALNVIQCINNLDAEKSEWDLYEDGSKGRLLKYSFHTDRFPESSLFKIPETSKTEILTYSCLKDEDDEFFSIYRKYNLTGLEFEEIFHS